LLAKKNSNKRNGNLVNHMALRGIIFDFDGLILDTEVPGFTAWKEIFAQYDLPFTHQHWHQAIGTGPSAYDPALDLCSQVKVTLNPEVIRQSQLVRAYQILQDMPILPGVLEFIKKAKQLGIRMAVASSSPRDWVMTHLSRLDLVKYFEFILTCEDVERVKPQPDLFLLALEKLKINPEEAVVFEDSPNGITAARSAGIFVLAVPNDITRSMNTSHANGEVSSFTEISLEHLITQFDSK
jgi:HAD superfamily hydrolase (TIGR01509 family)